MSGEKRCGCAACEFAEYGVADWSPGRSVATDSTELDHEPATVEAFGFLAFGQTESAAPAPLPDAGGRWEEPVGSRWRKRPVEVTAMQVTAEWFDGDHPNPLHPVGIVIDPVGRCVLVPTLEGTMRGNEGDWIITGVRGERYPCKPDIFAATYEPVTPAPPAPEAPGEMSEEDVIDVVSSLPGDAAVRQRLLADIAALRASREAERQRGENLGAKIQSVRSAWEAACRERDEAREQRDRLLGQPPVGMKHCSIVFRQCPVGHGWLTATNWADFPCPTCAFKDGQAAIERLRSDLAAANARAEEAVKDATGLQSVAATERAARLKAERDYERLRDISLCRRQFPDGVVPGGTEECAHGWHDWYEKEYAAHAITKERLAAAEAEVKRLRERVEEDNAVCMCGCPPETHESLGEDGESCGRDDHECLRVAPSVATIFAALRARAQRLVEAGDAMTRCACVCSVCRDIWTAAKEQKP